MQQPLNHGMLVAILCSLQLVWLARCMDPLEKTVELITTLQVQVVNDGEREQGAYEQYASWCKETSSEKAAEVERFTREKTKIEAQIQVCTSDIAASETAIEELGKGTSAGEQRRKDLDDSRSRGEETFQAFEAQLMETIDLLGKAIEILEAEIQGKTALVQTIDTGSLESGLLGIATVIDALGVPSQHPQIAGLLQARHTQDPTAQAYKLHSQSIVEVMEDMRDKAEGQLQDLRTAEANEQSNYQSIRESLSDQITNLEEALKDSKSDKAAAEGKKASAEGDLSVAISELSASAEALKNTKASCLRTAADHENSVRGRNEELEVLAKAKKTIQASMTQSPSLVQISAKSTAQVRKHTHFSLISRQVVTLVKQLAAQQKSLALGQLASRLSTVVRFGVSTGKDPFSKVKEIIIEMIKKLEGELSTEVKEKEYCDHELEKTQHQKQELQDKITGLRGRTEQFESQSTALKSDVKNLQEELAELVRQHADLDRVRIAAHEAFLQTKADLQKSLDTTRTVIRMLRDYYANNEEEDGSALLQSDDSFTSEMNQPEAPQKFQKSSGAGSSIIGILEVSESDLAKNLAEEEAEDDDKQAEYEKLTQETKVLKAKKEKDVEYKTAEYKGLDKAITESTSDFETNSEELDAVEEYLKKVEQRCVQQPESFVERKARRDAEILGLQQALEMLQSDAPGGTLLQRGRRWKQHAVVHF